MSQDRLGGGGGGGGGDDHEHDDDDDDDDDDGGGGDQPTLNSHIVTTLHTGKLIGTPSLVLPDKRTFTVL